MLYTSGSSFTCHQLLPLHAPTVPVSDLHSPTLFVDLYVRSKVLGINQLVSDKPGPTHRWHQPLQWLLRRYTQHPDLQAASVLVYI